MNGMTGWVRALDKERADFLESSLQVRGLRLRYQYEYDPDHGYECSKREEYAVDTKGFLSKVTWTPIALARFNRNPVDWPIYGSNELAELQLQSRATISQAAAIDAIVREYNRQFRSAVVVTASDMVIQFNDRLMIPGRSTI